MSLPKTNIGGFGIDLTKAKNYQQETMQKNEEIIQRAKQNSTSTA